MAALANQTDFLENLQRSLNDGPAPATTQALLERILQHLDCAVGTIHLLDPATGLLVLHCEKGLPDPLRERVRLIPIGKGMAGLAAQRREPVQVCNLQCDTSGVAKPAARDAKVEGSIAVPMLPGGALCGVLGVAKPTTHEFTEPEIRLLQQTADLLGQYLGPQVQQV